MIWGKSLLSQVPHHVHIYKIIHRGTEIKIKDTFFLEILKTGEKKKWALNFRNIENTGKKVIWEYEHKVAYLLYLEINDQFCSVSVIFK